MKINSKRTFYGKKNSVVTISLSEGGDLVFSEGCTLNNLARTHLHQRRKTPSTTVKKYTAKKTQSPNLFYGHTTVQKLCCVDLVEMLHLL